MLGLKQRSNRRSRATNVIGADILSRITQTLGSVAFHFGRIRVVGDVDGGASVFANKSWLAAYRERHGVMRGKFRQRGRCIADDFG